MTLCLLATIPHTLESPLSLYSVNWEATETTLIQKNYCPISLLNTMGKIMEAIITARIGYMATTH